MHDSSANGAAVSVCNRQELACADGEPVLAEYWGDPYEYAARTPEAATEQSDEAFCDRGCDGEGDSPRQNQPLECQARPVSTGYGKFSDG